MDNSSCYKLNNKSNPFQEEKKSSKLKDCLIFSVIKVLGYSNIGCSLIAKTKNFIFFNFLNKKVSAYHTGSPFTQHYYVCRVLFLKASASLILFDVHIHSFHCTFYWLPFTKVLKGWRDTEMLEYVQ